MRPGRPEAAAVAWIEDAPPGPGPARARALRQALVAAVAGAVLFFALEHHTLAIVAWSIGGVTLLAGTLSPLGVFALMEKGIGLLARLIGGVMSWLLLAPLYLLVLTPFGLLARRGSRDSLHRQLDEDATSYWTTRADQDASLDKPY
ncbi:MAG: hypothetical protein AAGE52_17895 [Myxococcota bacterium]